MHDNAVVWRNVNVAEFESNCLRYFSIQNLRIDLHDTSNVYFIPHWTDFSYYMNNTERVIHKKASCSCSMLLQKANPPCYQKINTYVQDLYCNNLTSSLPSSLYCNMRRDICAISCFQYNKYKITALFYILSYFTGTCKTYVGLYI